MTLAITIEIIYYFKVAQLNIRELKQRQRRRQRERQKSLGFDWQNNYSARASRFFVHVHFLPSLHDCDVKVPNFTFYRERKQANTKSSFSFFTWI